MRKIIIILLILSIGGCYNTKLYTSEQFYGAVQNSFIEESKNTIIDSLNDYAIRLTVVPNEFSNNDDFIRYEFKVIDSVHWLGQKLVVMNTENVLFTKRVLWLKREYQDTTPIILEAIKLLASDTCPIDSLLRTNKLINLNYHQGFVHFRNKEHILEIFESGKYNRITYNDVSYNVLKKDPTLIKVKALHTFIINSFAFEELKIEHPALKTTR